MRSSLALLTTIALLLSQEAAYAQMGLLASVSSGHYVYDSNLTIYVDLEDSIYPHQKIGHARDIRYSLSGTTYVAVGLHAPAGTGFEYSMPLESVSVYTGSESLYQWVPDMSGGGEYKFVTNPGPIQVNVGDGIPDLANNGRNFSRGMAVDNLVDPFNPVVVVDSNNWFDIVGVFGESVLSNSFAANNGFRVVGEFDEVPPMFISNEIESSSVPFWINETLPPVSWPLKSGKVVEMYYSGVQLVSSPGGTVLNPIHAMDVIVDFWGVRYGFPKVPLVAGQKTYFDPEVAVAYEFDAGDGPKFSSVDVPVFDLDSQLSVTFGDFVESLEQGEEFFFTGYEGFENGAVDFVLSGIEPDANIVPTDHDLGMVFGFTFASDGPADVSINALTVPEPSTLVGLAWLGFFAAASYGWRRRRSARK